MIGDRMIGVSERLPRPLAPHHVTLLGAAIMADEQSSRPQIHSRSKNGTPLYEKACSHCGLISIVDHRSLGSLCHLCAMKARAIHKVSIPIHSYQPKTGVSLYERHCAQCGAVSIVPRERLTKLCFPCSRQHVTPWKHGFNKGPQGHQIRHPVYRVFLGMVGRCERQSGRSYRWYGARGIRVCDEWRHNPAVFLQWAL
jgi:hypothetical protein